MWMNIRNKSKKCLTVFMLCGMLQSTGCPVAGHWENMPTYIPSTEEISAIEEAKALRDFYRVGRWWVYLGLLEAIRHGDQFKSWRHMVDIVQTPLEIWAHPVNTIIRKPVPSLATVLAGIFIAFESGKFLYREQVALHTTGEKAFKDSKFRVKLLRRLFEWRYPELKELLAKADKTKTS